MTKNKDCTGEKVKNGRKVDVKVDQLKKMDEKDKRN